MFRDVSYVGTLSLRPGIAGILRDKRAESETSPEMEKGKAYTCFQLCDGIREQQETCFCSLVVHDGKASDET